MAEADYRRLAHVCCGKLKLPRSQRRSPRGPFTCGNCCGSYTTTRRKGEGERFCSRACAYTFRSAQAELRKDQASAANPPLGVVYCVDCGLATKGRSSRCAKCLSLDDCRRSMARYRAQNQITRTCRYCGCQWCAIVRIGRRQHCFEPTCEQKHRAAHNRKCRIRNRGMKNHQQRAKHFGVERRYFNPLSVLERDGWRCRLCGISTPRSLRGTNDSRAPELDHIVPLSQGGPHTKQNTQCACRRCNGAKGAKALGQALLFG